MTSWRVALVLLGLTLLAVPAVAHGNYVSADSQVSADGTVRVEFGSLVTDGFVVLHLDDGDSPGEVVGHAAVDDFQLIDFPVSVESATWDDLGSSFGLWVVLHGDNGDGQFNPEDDPPLTSATSDQLIADQLTVRKAADGPVNVMAEREQPQETGQNRVTLRTVRLATDGYVVIRADENRTPGRIVGQRQLSAGEHDAVRVTLEEYFYETRSERFGLWAVVHTSDGDDTFDSAADPPVMAGDARVMTRFVVKRTDPIERTPSPTPTASPASPTPTAGGHDHTHTAPATTAAGSHDDHSPTATDTVAPDRTTAGSHDHDDHDHATPEPTATPGQPGLGAVVVLLGLVVFTLLAIVRRR